MSRRWKKGPTLHTQYKPENHLPTWWGDGDVTYENVASRALPNNMWVHMVHQVKTLGLLSIQRYVVEFVIDGLKIQTFHNLNDKRDADQMMAEIEAIVAGGILENPERTDWSTYVRNELEQMRKFII